jgi:hypothetical protein
VSEHPIWHVGNRNPSITEIITDADGNPIDLNSPASTVQFRSREVGASALLVDQPATIVQTGSGGAAVNKGAVRYDWSAADIATNGILNLPRKALVWWPVTSGGKSQDLMEAIIEVRAHAPGSNAYVELEEFKATANLSGQTYADSDIQTALVAASRGIDKALGRRFYPDVDVNQVRYYTPNGGCTVTIDDLITLTSLVSDYDGDGTFEETWTQNTDFILEPLNAVADGFPFDTIRRHPRSGLRFSPYPRSLKLTGKFGWATTPDAIKQLTMLVAARLVKRTREAPFGIVSFGLDGAAVRASQMANDPEYRFLTDAYSKTQVLA